MTGKFYLPIEKGFKFHPVCANTFCRLLGCSKREFPQMKRALTDRDWLCPDLMKEIELLPSGVGQRTPNGNGRPSCFMYYFKMKDGSTHGLNYAMRYHISTRELTVRTYSVTLMQCSQLLFLSQARCNTQLYTTQPAILCPKHQHPSMLIPGPYVHAAFLFCLRL